MEKNTSRIDKSVLVSRSLFTEFFNSEKAGGLILLASTIISLLLANIFLRDSYVGFWHSEVGGHSLIHWINDGLMAVFFLLIGLELEREIYIGELSSLRKTMLPVSAAIGGMLIPAIVYLLINKGTGYEDGFGIPMATDIAFAISILSLLGSRIPVTLKVFLTALAIVDDLGAILIIALFYSEGIAASYLSGALAVFILLLVLNRLKVYLLFPYVIGGIIMWYLMSHSGIHPTISGVLLAFAIPFRKTEGYSPSYRLQHFLHKPVAIIILPLFALANTAIIFSGNMREILFGTYSIGVMAGLFIGKPIGILSFSYLAVKLKLSELPSDINWKQILGTGFLAGIGFTMSIFITLLAFRNNEIVDAIKISILVASLISGITGYLFLKISRNSLR